MIDDLFWMADQWKEDGAARKSLMSDSNLGVSAPSGYGFHYLIGNSLAIRMKLGLIRHAPEKEHDCFSDNTHYSHYYDVKGI